MRQIRSLAPSLTTAAAALLLALVPANAYSDRAEPQEAGMIEGDIERGEGAYAEDCASCHRSPARFMANVPGDDDAARADWLEDFLPDHYAPDDQARADIIAWLLAD